MAHLIQTLGAKFRCISFMGLGMLAIGCSSFSATINQIVISDAGIDAGGKLGGATGTGGVSGAGGATSTVGGTGAVGGVLGGTRATAGATAIGTTSSAGGTTSSNATSTMGGVPNTTASNTAGGVVSTGGTATGGASSSSTTAYCTINSVMYANGAPNPDDSCQSCQVDVSTSHWVARSEGAQCDTGKVCHNDSCQAGCWIGSQYYASGSSKTPFTCLTCQPSASISDWTPDAANYGCSGQYEIVDKSKGLCLAKMAQIRTTDAGEVFSIDITEVTKGQYDGWLATNPVLPASNDPISSWNTSFAEQGVGFTGNDAEHHPVVYVDWCDAYAYCSGVGKRLCGAIAGGPSNADAADGTTNQWDCACTSCGNWKYPWDNTNDTTYCNGIDGTSTQTTVVASFPKCVTPSGVFDLMGNVNEWENRCDGNEQSNSCAVRGDSFASDPRDYAYGCLPDYPYPLVTASSSIGFRCCSK